MDIKLAKDLLHVLRRLEEALNAYVPGNLIASNELTYRDPGREQLRVSSSLWGSRQRFKLICERRAAERQRVRRQ